MNSRLSFALLAVTAAVALTEARIIPAEPVSVMLDPYGNPVMFLREKRTPAGPYPHRAMMFTGYYRPVRKANGQASGVFAQGNAVSGNAYLGGGQPDYLQRGPEPIDESEVSSAEAEAAPNPLEHHVDEEEQHYHPVPEEQHDQPDSVQDDEQEPSIYATEAPLVQQPEVQQDNGSRRPTKKQSPKKTKKTPVPVESEEEEDEEEDDDDDDDEPAVPYVPFKANRRRQGDIPNLNNFFPMVFSFPRGMTRGGSSSGMPPGMITAIANSYATGKGGVASSVATAYGGSPQGKKQRRAQPAQE